MDSSALPLLLALAAGQAAGLHQGMAQDADAPPPGTPAEQALWKAAVETDNQLVVERARASRLQVRARAEAYDDRLAALAALAAKPGAPEGAAAIRARLLVAWTENVEIVVRQWPVDPTRTCQYQVLLFESAMRDDDPARRGATLPEARTNLKVCLEKARLVLAALTRSNEKFEASLAEATRVLAGAATAAAAPGTSAPSGNAAGEGAR